MPSRYGFDSSRLSTLILQRFSIASGTPMPGFTTLSHRVRCQFRCQFCWAIVLSLKAEGIPK